MARRSPSSKLEQSVREAAQRFAGELLEIIRSATVEELSALQTLDLGALVNEAGAPPTRRRAAAAAKTAAPAVKKPRKKRAWPICTVAGCTKNVYMPSGAQKMCYQHYLEAGGKESPLVRYRRQQKSRKTTPKAKTTGK